MKRVIVFLTVLFVFLSLSFAGSGNYEIKQKKELRQQGISADVWGKLVGGLKDAVTVYQKSSTIEALNRTKAKKAKRVIPSVSQNNGIMERDTEEVVLENGLYKSLINPVIQKRWKNPSYDVLNCLVKIKGDQNELEQYNAKVRSVSDLGDYKIVNVEIASQDILKIAQMASVEKISPVLNEKILNDKGSEASGAAKIRRKQGGIWKLGYTGQGVVVGIIDTGIDWTHPDFIDPVTGGTRILYIWDTYFDTPGQTPADLFGGNLAGLNYGTVWTRQDINDGRCTSTDTNGHGTHVTGSAAGNGGETGQYTGMAPMADLIIVRGLDDNGNLFIFELSQRLNKACAVNMSYGPSYALNYVAYWPEDFPADGSSLDAQWFKGLIDSYGPGHICNKSAGNDGEWNSWTNTDYEYYVGGHHSTAALSDTSSHTLVLPDYNAHWLEEWGYSPNALDYLFINVGMWYESPIQVTFISPNGNAIGPMVHGTAGVAADFTGGDGVIYYDLTYGQQPNGAYPAYFDFGDYFNIRYYPQPGKWKIIVEPIGDGSGVVDMWAGEVNIYLQSDFYWMDPILCYFNNPDRNVVHSNYVMDEGNAEWMFSTAAYTAKPDWESIDGHTYHWAKDFILNDIATFSSPGPSRDRRVKPDIAAPGNTVMSSMSSQVSSPEYAIDPDGMHYLMSGTSQAAPHVTGGIALMLQKNDSMNVTQVRNMLVSFARHDRYTDERGAIGMGYGKLNVKHLKEPPVAMIDAKLQNDGTIKFDGTGSYDEFGFALDYEFDFQASAVDGTSSVNFSHSVSNGIGYVVPDSAVDAYYRVKFRVNDEAHDSEWVYSDWILVQN